MEHLENSLERDELRMRFTAWLETVVKRAKIDYLRKQKRHEGLIPIGEIIDSDKVAYDLKFESHEEAKDFDFEDERLAYAFSLLTPARQQILKKLFVLNLTTQEIMEELNCSAQNVYNMRLNALNELKRILSKENK